MHRLPRPCRKLFFFLEMRCRIREIHSGAAAWKTAAKLCISWDKVCENVFLKITCAKCTALLFAQAKAEKEILCLLYAPALQIARSWCGT